MASKNIQKNEKFSLENLTCKRPGTGISPMLIPKLIGKKSNKSYKTDEIIKIKRVKGAKLQKIVLSKVFNIFS